MLTKRRCSLAGKKVGRFRNLKEMEGRPGLYQFEVMKKDGSWQLVTNLGGQDRQARQEFARKTAEGWIKK